MRIDRLGASGDGVVEGGGRPVFVPDALPGEDVAVERSGERGRVLGRGAPSPDRIEPFCPYYGHCGGCVAQHVGPALYGEWKRAKVAGALSQAGLSGPVEPLLRAGGEGRRRLTFPAREGAAGIRVGFMARRSHELVEIDRCPISVPGLRDAAGVARALASRLRISRKPLDIAITSTLGGLDVDLRGSGPLPDGLRQSLIAEGGRLGLARLSRHGELLAEFRRPAVRMARAEVVPPAGGFLQATEAGEAALAAAIGAAASGAGPMADQFSGSGPFSLRLAAEAEIHAVESDAQALLALDRAARATPGLRRVTTEARDLFRRPLLPTEIERFDAIVLDPPRAGAEAQMRQLILSSCPAVIMASCDPGTFARDAAILAAGGFTVERVLPVDQFEWSAHVEIVGVFRRPAARRRRR